MHNTHSFYFDKQDYALLAVINRFLDRDNQVTEEHARPFFHTSLHPHGIKELAVSQEIRVAYAVINLLDSLEAGQAKDRLAALRSLHEEVLSTGTSFRHNTGRVLIQLMKDLVRAHGNYSKQLCLAHDFRKAASGKRRIIRSLLRRYHLLEMPESWNQLSFDHHVHDANTKGRKSPTHLVMDAWIKGIRQLDVVYYNFIEPVAMEELLHAADIVGIKVRVGVEFQARFRGRYVQFIWQPRGFHSVREMRAFMEEKPMRHLMRMGKEASLYHHQYVMRLLERYNVALRHEMGQELGLALAPIEENEILAFVGVGQTSRTHLAELIFLRVRAALQAAEEASLHTQPQPASPPNYAVAEALTPDSIIDVWFSLHKNPDIELPLMVTDGQHVPEIMRLLPTTLIDWLTSIHTPCHIILNLSQLTAKDVLELLYECDGAISHLELFNLKNFLAGSMPHVREISALHTAINEGSAVALKRLIRTMLKELDAENTKDSQERSVIFQEILRNIPRLQNYYTTTPLGVRIGSDSTSRYSQSLGMGFAFSETLPPKARKELAATKTPRRPIPLHMDVCERTTHCPKRYSFMGNKVASFVRTLPLLRHFNTRKQEEWVEKERTCHYQEPGNITPLGGINKPPTLHSSHKDQGLSFGYLSTNWQNVLKVAFGFFLTAATFAYTQSWWFLAWFGPIIWFAITGLRNVLQTMLGAGGIKRSPLLRLNNCISWSRIADSLMFTGLSVPILELGVRKLLLEWGFGINSTNSPVLFFTVMSLVNSAYISSHNLIRGLPAEAVVGNIFRSFLAIPLSVFYSAALGYLFLLAGWGTPEELIVLQQGASVISKLASDSVAAVIEGFADKAEYLRMRYWDYNGKLRQLFADYSQLDLLLPEEDTSDYLQRPKVFLQSGAEEVAELEKRLSITALDLLYFWMYQPRSRVTLAHALARMSSDEREIFASTQMMLLRVQEVSQMFVDGLTGLEFAKPLAFYLEKHEEYLHEIQRLLRSLPPVA
ncbi:hypothetical protein [Desulfovibrio cuneatus]|uniref:hypothetical protein n=1 Tax=Desulfovibrio cuneatus TaxID=159728 RepID=UPI00041BD870|nr:hypothetical protein [Desulfovibrio cuneatus]